MKKPAITKQLKKGKAIGIFNGWTDTINWTTQSVANLKGKQGEIEIDWGDGSHPTIGLANPDNEEEAQVSLTFKGTDGSEVTIGDGDDPKVIEFASASDSKITVNVSSTSNGCKITIGAYYY